MEKESVAVIDIGTNTFHLLITEVNREGEFYVKHKFKEMVKLGEGGIDADIIADAAFQRGLNTLKVFAQYIQQHKCNRIIAFATSAIRTAQNGKDFIEKVYEQTGILIKVINGNEEAALIYEGVRNGIQLPNQEPVLIMDIGGGSVEFIVANSLHPLLLRSLKLGASRIYETFKPSDPMTPQQITLIENFYYQQLQSLFEEVKEFQVKKLIGTSGAFETLATMIAYRNGDTLSAAGNINGYRFSANHFLNIHQQLILSNREQRLQIQGMDKQRVDLINVASILIATVQKHLNIEQFMVSTYALKDGIFYTHLGSRVHGIGASSANEKSLREKSIDNLCKKYNCAEQHTNKVLQIALSLFEQTQELHWYGDLEKELLTYATLLHDVGYFIHRSGHHKHGQYIIMNSQIPGFSHDELLLIGNIVRYHRKSLPSKEHPYFNILSPEHKIMVKKLAAFLRLADHLDKGHRGLVQAIKVYCMPPIVSIDVIATEDITPELEAANKEKTLFEEAFKVKLTLQAVTQKVNV
ncbi:MAG: phosphatase [Bacteroidia bacterium]|nr:MAG: phosphatase [Bacteroidia bacterium]